MPTPFFKLLNKTHTVSKLTSSMDTKAAIELQTVLDSNPTMFERRKIELLEELQPGRSFRLTKGKVYETWDAGETIDVKVAVQVKGHSLTWYFWVQDGMDQYPQAFRDKLYNAAAEAHKHVSNGCDLYYRGSNAVHVKLMHHVETESNHNHNHYRLRDNVAYKPADFNEHMEALKGSQIHDEFFEEGEIDELCEAFSDFYAKWTVKVGNEPSLEEQYFMEPAQQLEKADLLELKSFGAQQEPCRISEHELKVDYNAARKEIERIVSSDDPEKLKALLAKVEQEYQDFLAYRKIGGSRGLNSKIASTRQIKNSANPVISSVVGMDDTLGKEVPDIPNWAVSIKTAVERSTGRMLEDAARRVSSPDLAAESHQETPVVEVTSPTPISNPNSDAEPVVAAETESVANITTRYKTALNDKIGRTEEEKKDVPTLGGGAL